MFLARASAPLLLAAATVALVVGCRGETDPKKVMGSVGGAGLGGKPGETTVTAASVARPPGKPGVSDGTAPPGDLPILPRAEGAPPVGLDGTSSPWPPPVPEGVPRLAAILIETPVLAQADVFSPRLGILRAGAVVEMDPKVVTGKGCGPGFRAIKPLGFVCLGSTTLDLQHPVVRTSTRRPDVTQKLPYMYGLATRGGPAYSSLPSAEILKIN